MSAKLMGRVFAEVRGLTAGERVVLLAIAEHADDAGQCWPSMARLADRCEMSDRHVRRTVRALEAHGVLWTGWQEGRGSRANLRTNLFRVVLPTSGGTPTSPHAPVDKSERGDTHVPPRGDTHVREGGHPRPRGGTPTSPRTVSEPNEEPSVIHHQQNGGTPTSPLCSGGDEADAPTIADGLVTALGYIDAEANPGEIRYVERALARGWTAERLLDAAVEVAHRDDITDARRYFTRILEQRANTSPDLGTNPATTQGDHTESPQLQRARVIAARLLQSAPAGGAGGL